MVKKDLLMADMEKKFEERIRMAEMEVEEWERKGNDK